MARRADRFKVMPYVQEYHVYSDATSIGEIQTVKNDSGANVVRMSTDQAQYWLDQGAIGVLPKGELSAEAQALLEQFRHTPAPSLPPAQE